MIGKVNYQMKVLYSKEIRDKYQDQKWMAKSRGIGFYLTIEEWVNWWEANLGRHWLKKRGCKSGQYVMARMGDKGAYEFGNIECITANQNHKDTKRHGSYAYGEAVKSNKLRARDVRIIFLSHPSKELLLAKFYNIRASYIARIKRRRSWYEITKDLGEPQIKGYARGDLHPLATLSVETVRNIYLAKGTNPKIANMYGVRKGLVCSIRTGRSWASVTQSLGPIPNKKRGPYRKK